MCITPISLNISSRLRYFYPNQPFSSDVSVPCGNCLECRTTHKNDMYLRIKSEFEDCLSHAGKCAFVTFTYSEDTVPYVRYSFDGDSDIAFESVDRRTFMNSTDCMFTFSKPHLQRFFNSLRKHFERYFKSLVPRHLRKNVKVPSIRYIVVGEYGSGYTQRPHYHALIFLPKLIHKYLDSNNIDFISLCKKFWSYGIVSASNKGLYVDNDFCCGYVAKYVGKSLDVLKLACFSRFFEFIKTHFDDLSPRDYFYQPTVVSYFKHYLRISGSRLFCLKSKNFGASMLDSLISLKDDIPALYDKIDKGISIVRHSKVSHLSYPRYILNKLCYNHRSDGSYYLSDIGLSLYDYSVKSSIESTLDRINDFDVSLVDTLPMSFFDSIELSAAHVKSVINSLKFNPYKHVIYSRLFHGRSYPLSYDVDDLLSMVNTVDSDYQDVASYLSRLSISAYLFPAGRRPIVPALSSGIVYRDLVDSGKPTHFDPVYNHDLYFPMFLFNKVTFYLLGSLLDTYNKINERNKLLHDVLCFHEYG